jgi:hypothetical protein
VGGGQESHDARALHGIGQLALMPGADACALARQYLHVKIDEGSQKTGVFVVDLFDAVFTEEAILLFFKRIFHNL